jgi:hypothetical protein
LDVAICCHMLHGMILNGKDEDVDELMFQWKVKNVPKNKKGVEKKNFDKGYEVMRWVNLMLNLHCNAMRFLRSTNALQWNNTWEIID